MSRDRRSRREIGVGRQTSKQKRSHIPCGNAFREDDLAPRWQVFLREHARPLKRRSINADSHRNVRPLRIHAGHEGIRVLASTSPRVA